MAHLTPQQKLEKAEQHIAEQKKQITALRNGMSKLERMIRAVELRSRRAETTARAATTEIAALRRKLKV